MMLFLPRDNLQKLLSNLGEMLEIVAPIRVGDESVFVTWKGQPIDLETNPLIPPTEFLLPPKEVLFKYIQQSGRYSFKEIEPKTKIILGIRPCDLNAVLALDKILGSDPSDKLYLKRRGSTILAVINCNKPAETCFCSQLGASPECKGGFDLLFTELSSGFIVESGSPAGMLILKKYPELFLETNTDHFSEMNRLKIEARKILESGINRSVDNIMKAIGNADWEALGKHCLGCGGCTFVCPICHCFNVLDVGIPDGERIRCRDTCILSGFSRMAGGVNPRRSASDRIRNMYLDKFQFIPENTGLLGCVGCGRCTRVCMANIDRWCLQVLG
jgi:sulfhydrogenase subunit beta (sulfur reductase)